MSITPPHGVSHLSSQFYQKAALSRNKKELSRQELAKSLSSQRTVVAKANGGFMGTSLGFDTRRHEP